MQYWVFIASGPEAYEWYLKCASIEGCWCHRQGKGSGFGQVKIGDQIIFYVSGIKQFLGFARVTGLVESSPYSFCNDRRFLLSDFHSFPAPVSLKAAQVVAGFPGSPRGSYRRIAVEVYDGILKLSQREEGRVGFVFRREVDLELFILDNWDRLDFLKDYTIFKSSEGRIGRQLKVSSGSRPDFLCRHRVTGDYLVLELKYTAEVKDIGQVIRYIEEVTRTLAKKRFAVKGMLAAQSFDPDIFTCNSQGVEFIKLDISVKSTKLSPHV